MCIVELAYTQHDGGRRIADLQGFHFAVNEVGAAQQGKRQVGVVVQSYLVVVVNVPGDAHGLLLLYVVYDAQHVECLALILLVVGFHDAAFLVDHRYRGTTEEAQAEEYFLFSPTLRPFGLSEV